MSPLMQTIYEHVYNSTLPRYFEYGEYRSVSSLLARLEGKVSGALSEEGRVVFQRYLDAQRELSLMEAEAMFQAAFAAARELS